MTEARETLRFFHPERRRLVSVRADGGVFTREIGAAWKRAKGAKAAPGTSVETFLAQMRGRAASLPCWAQEVTELPTMAEVEHWLFDGIALTTDGQEIEPDGTAGNGAPSWLVALGLI